MVEYKQSQRMVSGNRSDSWLNWEILSSYEVYLNILRFLLTHLDIFVKIGICVNMG